MDWRPISADSHITEPPNCYVDNIDPAWRERAPRIQTLEKMGDTYIVEGMKTPVPLGLIAAAGIDPKDIRVGGAKFADLHRGGWDPSARLADQDKDGVGAELIYPTVGMLICNHPDFDYKKACFDAYNRWLQEYCSHAPDRLIGLGQTAMRTIKEGVEDLHRIKQMGFKGVMMPGNPGEKDYDHPDFDPLWRAAVELELPLSFHILTSSGDNTLAKPRGPKVNGFLAIIRGCQDIMGMLVFSGVFERHPKLKVVCVEADAGWAPHFSYRMDHVYKRHRYWMKGQDLARLPSEYFRENISLTFQDDWTAFQFADRMGDKQLMWASDFPHSDSTWPWSQDVIKEQTAHLDAATRKRILHDNVAELYKLAT
jgi:predicted TIM-barrel fold metal-dependent hydrolase